MQNKEYLRYRYIDETPEAISNLKSDFETLLALATELAADVKAIRTAVAPSTDGETTTI